MNSGVLVAPPPGTGAFPALLPGACQVWWARPTDLRGRHDALLGSADLERRSRLRRTDDRRRTSVAAAVLRLVLAAHTGVPPHRVPIERTCPRCGGAHGRPRVPGVAGVHVSVSHSAGSVAVAVSRAGPVGVDVEEVGRLSDTELACLADQALAPEERAALARRPAADRARGFTTYWTRKEALVKATGEGLGVPLDHVIVSPPSEPPRLLRWTGRHLPASLHALHPSDGLVGTLAVLGVAPTDVTEHDAGPVLRSSAHE